MPVGALQEDMTTLMHWHHWRMESARDGGSCAFCACAAWSVDVMMTTRRRMDCGHDDDDDGFSCDGASWSALERSRPCGRVHHLFFLGVP